MCCVMTSGSMMDCTYSGAPACSRLYSLGSYECTQ